MKLAQALHVSRALIQRKNVIPFYKVGHCTLFDLDLVMAALKKHERNGAQLTLSELATEGGGLG
jgi:hypothetical protein